VGENGMCRPARLNVRLRGRVRCENSLDRITTTIELKWLAQIIALQRWR